MRELDPRRLLVLVAIADEGGVAPAARTLGHTPSAVSQQLARLERDVGVPLVDRSAGRLTLTAAGRLLAGHGDRIGRVLDEAARQLGALSGQATGPVVIGANPAALAEIVTAALPVLAGDHPGIEPVLVETDEVDGPRRLRAGELDVLLISDDRDTATPLPPGARATTLIEDGYRIVVPRGWPVPRTPADLAGLPWIGAPAGYARARAFARFAREHAVTPAREHVAAHPPTVRRLLAAGLGAALLPAFVAATTTDAVLCPVPVSGSFLVRAFRRRGPAGPVPAAEAAVGAIRAAMLVAAERYADSGRADREPTVSRPVDPSEPAG